jgi:protein-S-isoprenylcysteine O-methyltransferase Ste14
MDQAALARKAGKRLAVFFLIVAAVLFISAGTLAYWQGWVFVGIYALGTSLITAYFLKWDPALIARRMRAGPRAEQEPTQKIVMRLANVFFLALIVFPGIDHRFGWSQLSFAWVLFGDALVAIGLLIVFLVFRENSFASAVIEIAKDQRVISSGPYRIVRHPMYVGGLSLIAGGPLALGSAWGLLICLPIAAVIVWRLIEEERYLSKHLAGYDAYCASTPYRLIPGVY